MNKSILERFISKYNLSGACESVTWHSNGKELSTKFISDDKHVVGSVSTTKTDIDDGEYSIYETTTLRSLLGVLDSEVKVKVNKTGTRATSLSIKDASTNTTFVLSDASNIPGVPTLKTLPDFELTVELDKAFIERFVKAKSALVDVETFAVVSDGKAVDIVLGYSDINTNRVTIRTGVKNAEKIDPIHFNARYMKEILSANKEATAGTLKVSSEGLAQVTFDIPDFTATYYLPKMKVE